MSRVDRTNDGGYDRRMASRTVCILDGGRSGATDGARDAVAALAAARGFKTTVFRLRDVEIAPCRGCFACWVKTPGICIVDDAAREIAQAVARSDLLVYVTPVTFGGYSSELKKGVDRLIPLILPYFTFVGREVHHIRRYRHYASLLAVGVLPRPDEIQERIFRKLVRRNSINFHAPDAEACFVYEDGIEGRPSLEDAWSEVIEG